MYKIITSRIADIAPDIHIEKIINSYNKTLLIAHNTLYVQHHNSAAHPENETLLLKFADLATVQDAQVSYNGELLAISLSTGILIIENERAKFHIPSDFSNKVIAMVFSADSRQLICAIEEKPWLHIYQFDSRSYLTYFYRLPEPIVALNFSGETNLLAISTNNRIWSIKWRLVESNPLAYRNGIQLPASATKILYSALSVPANRPVNLIFHVLNYTICCLSNGVVICFNVNDYCYTTMHNVLPFDHLQLLSYHGTSIVLLFANLRLKYATTWKITTTAQAKVEARLLTKFYLLDTKLCEFNSFADNYHEKISDGKIKINYSEYLCQSATKKFQSALHDIALQKSITTDQSHYDFVRERIMANFNDLSRGSAVLQQVLQNYSQPFRLTQIHVDKVQRHAGVIRACVFLVDCEMDEIVHILKHYRVNVSPWRLQTIYAEFSLSDVSYAIETYLEDSTYVALCTVPEEVITIFQLLLPPYVHQGRIAKASSMTKSPNLTKMLANLQPN